MFITLPEFAPPGSPAHSLRPAQASSIVELNTRAPYLHATFAMTPGSYKEVREFLAASWLAVNEIRQRPAVASLMELQYVTPPVPLNGSPAFRKLVSVWRSTMKNAPNESVFIFRSTTDEELIEGEWVPNQFLGVLPKRELVLNLEPAVAMAVGPRSLSGKRSAPKN